MSTEDEVSHLRSMLQKAEAEKLEVQARNDKAVEYLELIRSDRGKTQGELAIIDVTLDNLKGDGT